MNDASTDKTNQVQERRRRGGLAWYDLAAAAALLAATAFAVLFDVARPQKAAGGPVRSGLFSTGGVFALRTAENRQEWIADLGGTPASEAAVEAGLDWLVRHQAEDGSWSSGCLAARGASPLGCCVPGQVCPHAGQDFAMAQTGLAILALQAGGHFAFNERKHSPAVARGLKWLIAHQQPDGGLVNAARPRDHRYMYEHGIAAFALCEAVAVSGSMGRRADGDLFEAATRAVKFIEQSQDYDGGWRYTESKEQKSDTSVSGWQVLALKSAEEGGIELAPQVTTRAREFFKSCESSRGRTAYMAGGNHFVSEATTGVGMLFHEFLLHDNHSPLVEQGAAHLATYATSEWSDYKGGAHDYYLWYNCTLAMYQAGGPAWDKWNNVVRDRLVSLQEKSEGCAHGSWPADDRWGAEGGRVYSTALAVLSLEVYYRFKRVESNASEPK